MSESGRARLKILYMVWPPAFQSTRLLIKVPDGFVLRILRDKDRARYFRLVSQEEDWLNSPEELNKFLNLVLPDGLFLVERWYLSF